MLPRYFDYIFVHLKQKARLTPEIFVNFRPEPDPKSPARLTTLVPRSLNAENWVVFGRVDVVGLPPFLRPKGVEAKFEKLSERIPLDLQ